MLDYYLCYKESFLLGMIFGIIFNYLLIHLFIHKNNKAPIKGLHI